MTMTDTVINKCSVIAHKYLAVVHFPEISLKRREQMEIEWWKTICIAKKKYSIIFRFLTSLKDLDVKRLISILLTIMKTEVTILAATKCRNVIKYLIYKKYSKELSSSMEYGITLLGYGLPREQRVRREWRKKDENLMNEDTESTTEWWNILSPIHFPKSVYQGKKHQNSNFGKWVGPGTFQNPAIICIKMLRKPLEI